MAAGLLNTSTPSRGWYFSSLVIIVSLAAHAYARPFKNPWVDATEGLSLWSTLFVFQGGMVWNMEPEGELAALLEVGAIAMVCATCVLALYVEYRVYQERHGQGKHTKQRDKDFDDNMDSNPLHDDTKRITVSISKEEASSLPFDLVAMEENSDAIKLVAVHESLKQKHPELQSGLFLRQIGESAVDGLKLAAITQLIADIDDGAKVTVVFSEQQPTLGGAVIAAAGVAHRVDHASNLNLISLVRDVA
eukprot:COSAG02_NODE_111_length_36009_cov_42.221248_25_plen_248_part_00